MVTGIVIAAVLVGGVGLFIGVFLGVAGKKFAVEVDEKEGGLRKILNFGHTFGHAIEKKYNYETYTHGEGVAVGMVMSCEYGEKLGITHNGVTDRMISILKNYNLPVDVQISKDELAEAVAVDKKGEGSKINLILIEDIGKVMIKKLEKSDFLK